MVLIHVNFNFFQGMSMTYNVTEPEINDCSPFYTIPIQDGTSFNLSNMTINTSTVLQNSGVQLEKCQMRDTHATQQSNARSNLENRYTYLPTLARNLDHQFQDATCGTLFICQYYNSPISIFV